MSLRLAYIVFAFVFLTFSTSALANSQSSGFRELEVIGCDLATPICFVTVSGNPVGPNTCNSRSIRWSTNSTNGQEVLSLLTAAFHAGLKVDFRVIMSGCSPQAGYPTFTYINIETLP